MRRNCTTSPVSIQLDEYGFKREYHACEATAHEAEQGRKLWHSVAYQEQLGRDLFVNECTIIDCPTDAARRGWLAAQRQDSALFAALLAVVPA